MACAGFLRRIERMRTGIMRSRSTQARPQVVAVSSHLTPVFHHKLRARKMDLRNTPLPTTSPLATIRPHNAARGLANNSILLQHGPASSGPRVDLSKPSYAQLTILLIPAAFLAAYLGVCSLLRLADLELPLWLKVWSSAYVAGMLHVAIMGLVGALSLGVPIERISFGLGKRWFRTSIASIPISFGLPFGASVKFIGDEANVDPRLLGLRGCELELSGCAVLLVLAAVVLGRHATFDVLGLWQQVFEGALSPFGQAQVLLADLGRYLAGFDELSIFAVASFGLAAMNLLPLPMLNGGNAVMYFVSATIYPFTEREQEWLFRVSLLIYLFACGSWLLALLFSAYNSWARPLLYSSMLGAPA